MTFIFRNRTIFWDISKWNRGQTKWDGGSILFFILEYLTLGSMIGRRIVEKKRLEENGAGI